MEDQALMGCRLGKRSDASAGNGRIGREEDRRGYDNSEPAKVAAVIDEAARMVSTK
jgi:hypothetical protein